MSRRFPEPTRPEGRAKLPAVLLDRFPFAGRVYTKDAHAALARDFHLLASGLDGSSFAADPELYADCEVIFGTWGLPRLDASLLDQLPRLRAVFHAAGAWEALYTEEAQEREILFCSTVELNSHYVTEQCVACILLCLKGFFAAERSFRKQASWHDAASCATGIYRSRVGLVGMGRIGRRTSLELQARGIEVLAHDPALESGDIEAPGVASVSLEALFESCNVVSLHLPGSTATDRMIGSALLRRMPSNASLINTARGSVLDEDDLAEVLGERPDLTAVLDVCRQEPPAKDCPLLGLINCILTPHLAGAIAREREHLGDSMVEEAGRWLRGEALHFSVNGRAPAAIR